MDYKKIIAESWFKTQQNKKAIFWFGFLPAIFTTTVGAGFMLYQFFAIKMSHLFNEKDESLFHEVLTFGSNFLKDNPSFVFPLMILGLFFGIFYLILPTITKASAIQMIARQKNNQQASVWTGFRFGLKSFLPLLEYMIIIHTFTLSGIFSEVSFVLRNLGISLFLLLSPIFAIFFLIGIFATLFFVYAEFYIIIDDEDIFQSIKKSISLVMNNMKHTFLITILMVIIGIRIILQIVLILFVPALFILSSGYLGTLLHPAIGITVGFIVLLLAAYLTGIIEIFSYHVWTHTFLELSKEKEITARENIRL